MRETTNLHLTVWNNLDDNFDYTELRDNWDVLEAHDHSSNKGVQIPTEGIQFGAITSNLLASDAVTTTRIADLNVTTGKIADGAVTLAKLAAAVQPAIPTWVAAGGTLPSSPADGQLVYYQADATNGVVWHLRYNSGSASSYKWEFVGGSPLFATVVTDETLTADGTYHDTSTVGPSITFPLAGDYRLEGTANFYSSSATASRGGVGIYSSATSAIITNCEYQSHLPTGTVAATVSALAVVTGRAAAEAVKLQYSYTVATAHVRYRRLLAIPVRVG